MDLMSANLLASRPFTLAVFKETSTIEAKTAMMAMTTNNSIKVKPFLLSFNIFVCMRHPSSPPISGTQNDNNYLFYFLRFDLFSTLAAVCF